MEQTVHFKLNKPGLEDYAKIETINENMDMIDEALAGHAARHASSGADPITPAAIGAATANHTHTPAALGAAAASHTHTPAAIGAAAANHTHTPASLGAAAANHSHAAADVGAAAAAHNHSAANITSGTLAVARGGTGLTAAPSMLINLASTAAAGVFAASPRPGVTGTLPIARGGTGATTAAAARTALGAATTVTYNATVTASWTASGSYYYQKITVSGILATDNPIVDIRSGSDNAANELYSESICKVLRITTAANYIQVWATEAISTAFPIQIKVVR